MVQNRLSFALQPTHFRIGKPAAQTTSQDIWQLSSSSLCYLPISRAKFFLRLPNSLNPAKIREHSVYAMGRQNGKVFAALDWFFARFSSASSCSTTSCTFHNTPKHCLLGEKHEQRLCF